MTTPERKLRCIVHPLPLRNPCPNEALDELGICLHHLEKFHDHYRDVVASVIEQYPEMRGLLAKALGEAGP